MFSKEDVEKAQSIALRLKEALAERDLEAAHEASADLHVHMVRCMWKDIHHTIETA